MEPSRRNQWGRIWSALWSFQVQNSRAERQKRTHSAEGLSDDAGADILLSRGLLERSRACRT
jgi:hypothetical protein